jgi:type VI secretion system secreted protein VgrG
MAINLMGGTAVNITGGASGVSIVGPGGFISITEAGIAIMGTMVLINSGGSPTPATAASPASPESPSQPQSPQSPTAPTAPFTADDQSKFTKLG